MNQSAVESACPLSVALVSVVSVPRRLMRSPSPKSRWVTIPGTRCSASARFLSGNLPTSSAVRTSSTTVGVALGLHRLPQRLAVAVDDDFLERRAGIGTAAGASARAAPLRPNSAMATAVPTKVDLAILIVCSPRCYFSRLARRVRPRLLPQGTAVSLAVGPSRPLRCQYSTNMFRMPTGLPDQFVTVLESDRFKTISYTTE